MNCAAALVPTRRVKCH